MTWRGKLLAASGDAKTVKGEKQGFLTAIMYLAPHTIATRKTLCPHASPACMAACLYSAGRGAFNNVQAARIRKAQYFEADRNGFMADIYNDIDRFQAYATRKGFVPCVRLNGTSDIMFERIRDADGKNIMQLFPRLRFYDYTKIPPRLRRGLPSNYDLTFSQAENNAHAVRQALADGFRVATVFPDKAFPATWHGQAVIDGDASDLRFLDPSPCVVGLSAKGKARGDMSGFVQRKGDTL
jgi:hypothetical protein